MDPDYITADPQLLELGLCYNYGEGLLLCIGCGYCVYGTPEAIRRHHQEYCKSKQGTTTMPLDDYKAAIENLPFPVVTMPTTPTPSAGGILPYIYGLRVTKGGFACNHCSFAAERRRSVKWHALKSHPTFGENIWHRAPYMQRLSLHKDHGFFEISAPPMLQTANDGSELPYSTQSMEASAQHFIGILEQPFNPDQPLPQRRDDTLVRLNFYTIMSKAADVSWDVLRYTESEHQQFSAAEKVLLRNGCRTALQRAVESLCKTLSYKERCLLLRDDRADPLPSRPFS